MDQEKPRGKDAVKVAIMEASAILIAERGVNSVSLRDIAKAANVNHGLITRHFGSKEALVMAVGLHLVDSIFEERTLQKDNSLENIILGGFEGYSVSIRAVMRILLDTPGERLIVDAKPMFDKLLNWIRNEQEKRSGDTAASPEPIILLFVFASLVLGNELFGPYFRKMMNLSTDAYRELMRKASTIILTDFRTAPST
jgi:TetR/AcrR family transcriptional regulator, repressor for neighboring sulfatase